jgi:hypothetical protein
MTKLVGKSRLSITAMYRNGVALMHEQEFLADCFMRKTDPKAGSTIIAFSVPSQLAPSLQEALKRGDVELLIEGIASPTERAGA